MQFSSFRLNVNEKFLDRLKMRSLRRWSSDMETKRDEKLESTESIKVVFTKCNVKLKKPWRMDEIELEEDCDIHEMKPVLKKETGKKS